MSEQAGPAGVVVGLGLRGMTRAERRRALDAVDWAASREAAYVDPDLSLAVRRLLRGGALDEAGWDQAWALTARLVVLAQEQAGGPALCAMEDEPLVLEAARLLGAVRVGRVGGPR